MTEWRLGVYALGLGWGFGMGAIAAPLPNTPLPNTPLPNAPLPSENHVPLVSSHPPSPEATIPPSLAQSSPSLPPSPSPSSPSEALNLDPQVIEDSPVLQRWLEEIPDVRSQIRNDPAFRTRARLGYTQLPSTEPDDGFYVGVEDVFIGRTGFTISGDYQQTFEGDRQSYGGDLRYYIRPLGSSINIAPVVGYRHLETDDYTSEGVNVGVRLMLSLSRTGAADVAIAQSWVAPGTNEEVGLTTLSFGYAVTRNLRVATEIQRQNARQDKDSRFGIGLEWMF